MTSSPEAASAVPWRGEAYAEHSMHHRTADAAFLERCPPGEHHVVADLGCGSGEFTARLAAMVPHGRVTGIDADSSMLAVAGRRHATNLAFVQAPAQEVDRVLPPGSVDLVVSRAMLHWLPAEEHPRLYEAVFRVLRPRGVFHLEAAGPGNIPGVVELLEELAAEHGLPAPPPFPDPGGALERVEAAGFEVKADGVRTTAQRRGFTRGDLVGLLSSQAALVLTRDATPELGQVITDQATRAVDRLRRHDGSYDQTFVRLELLLRRPG